MKTDDDKNLGSPIPTKYPAELESMLKDLVLHSGLDRSQIIRRAVRFALDEVQRRKGADWLLYDEKPPIGFLTKKSGGKTNTNLRLNDTRTIPIYASIPAGWPDHRGNIQPIRSESVRHLQFPAEAFGLDVLGDSMNSCRGSFGPIHDGETVVLLPPNSREPRHGDIVAALCDGQTTLKRLNAKSNPPTLRAESTNPAFTKDIKPAHDLVIQGIMIGKL